VKNELTQFVARVQLYRGKREGLSDEPLDDRYGTFWGLRDEMPSVELPLRAIAGFHQSSIPDNFTFTSQGHALCQCNIVLAQLLSPAVSHLLASDPTADSFEIKLDSPHAFPVFISLLSTGRAEVSAHDFLGCLRICQESGNTELSDRISACHQLPAEITPADILDELRWFEGAGCVPSPLLEFAPRGFYEIHNTLSSQLKPETLDRIFSAGWVVDSEDALFDFIRGRWVTTG
jgi:hypothetical protein